LVSTPTSEAGQYVTMVKQTHRVLILPSDLVLAS